LYYSSYDFGDDFINFLLNIYYILTTYMREI